MNRDEMEGKGDKLKGRAKQAWGDITNNERLHDEGVADEASGSVQEGFGKTRRKVGETLDDLADRIKK
ncbi:MAG: CsbD family protein [Acidobacteria bacterium]|nr:CsbD family protein [Acidobacteriota bacterium]